MISTRNATYEPRNTKLLWYALIWAVIHIPFIAVSLFFGYRDTSCVHLFSSYAELSLGIWLRTDAYIMLIFMITLIILGYLSIRYHGWKCPYLVWQFVHVIYSLWRCAWLIVGSIMFWLQYNPSAICDYKIKTFTWIDLIVGYLFLFTGFFFIYCFFRPTQYPHLISSQPNLSHKQIESQKVPQDSSSVTVNQLDLF